MKRIAFIAAALLAATAVTAQEQAPPKPPNAGWLVTESKRLDAPLLVMVRAEVPQGLDTQKYATTVEMHWKYAPDANGMPQLPVITQMAKFEATIDPLQGDRLGFPMMIVTGVGERTWLWYVADPKAFGAALNRLVPDHPFPVTLNAAARDPEWKTWRAMRQKVH